MVRFFGVVNLALWSGLAASAQSAITPEMNRLQEQLKDCFMEEFIKIADVTTDPKYIADLMLKACAKESIALSREIIARTPVISPDLPAYLAKREREFAESAVIIARKIMREKSISP